ncbi:MAG: hypothetical protein AB7N80_12575 [Bdellovibrionales bacterium]
MRTFINRAFSGLALGLALWAAHAASDQSLDAAFEKDKIAYIKLYAYPKRPMASKSEALFTKRNSSARTNHSGTATSSSASPSNPAPQGTSASPPAAPSAETDHE